MAEVAEVVRRLLKRPDLDPWLPFPQNATCFTFGPSGRPLPIGALALLWSGGWPWAQPCPACGGQVRVISFGGLLSVGGGRCVCATCNASFFQPLGGLSSVAEELRKSPLVGSPFAPNLSLFGGSAGSDGFELLCALGLHPLPLAMKEPTLTVGARSSDRSSSPASSFRSEGEAQ
jgi:hypothetical protein